MKISKALIVTVLMSFIFKGISQEALEIIKVNENISTHFVSDYELEYMDISTNKVVGDFPLKNVLRIKPKEATKEDLGVVTIITEMEYRQYRLIYEYDSKKAHKTVNISLEGKTSFNNMGETLNSVTIQNLTEQMMDVEPSINAVVSKKNKQKLRLNNIWVIKDYIFVDYVLSNNTNIPYTIDEVRYKIIDRKIKKKESNQDVEIVPYYVHLKDDMFWEITGILWFLKNSPFLAIKTLLST